MAAQFNRIGIVGVGLIGGSVARAARQANEGVEVIGLDLDHIADAAAAAGIIDRVGDIETIANCELVVLAAPVSVNLAFLDRLSHVGTSALVTDVGGTKRQMHAKASSLGGALRFIGGHPMAGREVSGFAASDVDLFQGRRWFLVPTEHSTAVDLAALQSWVGGLGARAMPVDAETHDRVMAAVSALPQVTASVLMKVVGDRVEADGLRMAGPGLRDTTRLAGSAATWMTDGLAHNAREVADALDALILELRAVRDLLDTPERAAAVFTEAQEWRRQLLDLSR